MRVGVSLAACALLIARTIPVTAADPPDRRFAIGGGYAGSTIGVDTERDEDDSLTTSGFGILGRARWGERWGLQLRLVQGDESLGSGGEFSLGQVAVHPYFIWLESEQRYLHVYAKFGVAWTEFDEETPSGVSFSMFHPTLPAAVRSPPCRQGTAFA